MTTQNEQDEIAPHRFVPSLTKHPGSCDRCWEKYDNIIHKIIDINTAKRIWNILVKHCDAKIDSDSFINLAVNGKLTEFRFIGNLGFGGKIWNNRYSFYVTCYPEDETPVRLAAIKCANEELSKLQPELNAAS